MQNIAIRKKLHTYIDSLPDQNLLALEPLISFMAEDYWKPVIEPASPEEIAIIEEGEKDYERDPSSFVPLSSIK
jgi:hypothetical protein